MQQRPALDRAEPVPPDPTPAEAFAAAHLPRVFRFATMVSPQGADPQDLAQEAMARALERLDRLDPERGTAEAWRWGARGTPARDAGPPAAPTRTPRARPATEARPP